MRGRRRRKSGVGKKRGDEGEKSGAGAGWGHVGSERVALIPRGLHRRK